MAARGTKSKKATAPQVNGQGEAMPVSNLSFAMMDWETKQYEPVPAGENWIEVFPANITPAKELTVWAEIKGDEDHADLVSSVRTLRTELESFILLWGQEHGIEDLSLQQVLTLKRANVKSSWFYNPIGGKERTGKWVKIEYTNNKPVNPPAWFKMLLKTKQAADWRYDPKTNKKGTQITDAMLAKFTGRGAAAALSEAEEQAAENLFD